MAKLLYFTLIFGIFHDLGFSPAFVVALQEYNWNKITFKADDIADYIIKEKKNVYVTNKVESVLKKKLILLSSSFRPRRAQQQRTQKSSYDSIGISAVHSSCY